MSMDNSHSGLSHLTDEYLFQFSLSLNNIWLRYSKKAKGMFFMKHGVVYTNGFLYLQHENQQFSEHRTIMINTVVR